MGNPNTCFDPCAEVLRFRCLRPDHADVYDQHVLASDYDALAAENARLKAEMQRYLPLLERAEDYPVIWRVLTEGTGIATVNGYRAALSPTQGKEGA